MRKQKTENGAKKFVESLATFPGDLGAYYQWILKNGKAFDGPSTLSKSPGKLKECYYNAQSLTLFPGADGKTDYYEGWAIGALGLPYEHGFNVKNGKAIDPTWRDGKDYFGVKIPRLFIANHWSKTQMSENLLGRYYLKTKGGD